MTRILVIDDDATIRAVVRAVLEQEGYDVVEAANGAEGLERYQATCPDLIITDLQMPVMDGFQLLEALQRVVPPPMVIAISGAHHDLTQAQTLTRHTFAKPLPLKQLLATVQALMTSRSQYC